VTTTPVAFAAGSSIVAVNSVPFETPERSNAASHEPSSPTSTVWRSKKGLAPTLSTWTVSSVPGATVLDPVMAASLDAGTSIGSSNEALRSTTLNSAVYELAFCAETYGFRSVTVKFAV